MGLLVMPAEWQFRKNGCRKSDRTGGWALELWV